MPRLSPDVKRLMKLIAPAAAGAGAVQFNLLVSSALATGLLPHGSVSYIYYADRLNQLPLGLIGIGLGTVLLPTISHQLGRGDDAEAMATQNRGLELALFFTLPATVALVICGVPIITGLFQHGQFDAADALKTGQALAAFSLGLPSYILVKVLTPGYYARHDTKTPMRFAMISIAINLVLEPCAHHAAEACRAAACDRSRIDGERVDALSYAQEARPFQERCAAPPKNSASGCRRRPYGGRTLLGGAAASLRT